MYNTLVSRIRPHGIKLQQIPDQSLLPICYGPSVSKVKSLWQAVGKVTGPYCHGDCLVGKKDPPVSLSPHLSVVVPRGALP